MIKDREHCRFFGRFPGGPTVTVVSWRVLGPIVMCVYTVPEEGEFGYQYLFFLIFLVFDTLNRLHIVYN